MKSKIIYLAAFFAVTAVFMTSCDKSIEDSEQFNALKPADQDEDASTWTMIVLTTPNQIAVPVPDAVNSPAYQAELASIKDLQSKLTDKQRDIIAFWSAGGVMRWNQKLRELVARYNTPPAPRPDNTYPAPDAENPFGDPNFPFSNPPYAARAYSYVSVAQYEALKAAWFYKYDETHRREAPYKNDPAIKSLMPESDLPAYPSEDAVLSGVSAEMLKLLFPAAVEEITLMAADQRNAALWSGKASSSDIARGLALGKSVADEVKKRAAGDGMGAAGGTPAFWKELNDSVGTGDLYKTGEKAWVSQDLPKRPPMLPNFGKVKAWCMTPQQIIDGRPSPPPSVTSNDMKKDVEEVKFYAENLTRERLAIVHKWADGVRTYTPPGHWNDIATEYIRDANFSEVRAARAYALLNMAMHDAAVCCWETKFYYYNPRPSQMDPSIKTATGLPNFPAFTSGHSTFSGAASTMLGYLFPSATDYFAREAQEASDSRLYGGIHYRTDITEGMKQGKMVGEHTITFAKDDGAD